MADEVLKTIADGETAMNVNDELLNQLRQKKQKVTSYLLCGSKNVYPCAVVTACFSRVLTSTHRC